MVIKSACKGETAMLYLKSCFVRNAVDENKV